MLKTSWLDHLCQTLIELNRTNKTIRVAVVGIGHELRGDDAAGVELARILNSLSTDQEHLLVIDANSAPENCTGLLRRFGPDLVIMVDAAQMDEEPGEVQWIPWQATVGLGASTHTLPLHILANYLTAELECEVRLLGIQPKSISFGDMSHEIQKKVTETAFLLAETLCQQPIKEVRI
ncbi:MAG TPA: hydrogenase 3 maturation endopeptidase HyCI [Anaerolineae bacterium]|nr:hydrogenase 3 maturation endopeptidase HyCI [Anaerolineae bacterium]